MNNIINLLKEMGAEDAQYHNDGNAELIRFSFNGKKASICSWIGFDREAGIEVEVRSAGATMISISEQEPATLDATGFEALEFTEIGKA